MAVDRVAAAYYRRRSLTAAQVAEAVLALWRATGPSGFRDELVRAAGLLAAGQLVAAVQAAAYVTAAAEEQDVPPGVEILPRAFAGESASGRGLTDVLGAPSARVWTLLGSGVDYPQAVASGAAMLTRIVDNEVTQAGSNAAHVAVTGNADLGGYVRMLTRPSCGRCVILAGKWFEWNKGFARHPGCDCVHVPAAEATGVADVRTNPRAYFDSLSAADQDKYFGKANAEAIRDGSDIGQVVNASTVTKWTRDEFGNRVKKASSGLYEFDAGGGRMLQATRQGTTVRQGRAGRRMAVADGQLDGRTPGAFERANRPRLTPKSIYQEAAGDRAKAIDLLTEYGYLDSRPIDRSMAGLMADAGRPNPALGRR